MPETIGGGAVLYCGDCHEVLATLAENSIDAVVTDPPYHLTSVVKRFSKTSLNGSSKIEIDANDRASPFGRAAGGFMGQLWDGGDVAFRPETWAAVYRVMKPGAHLLAFGGTRTYHRLACAIEDAGFEIRDCVQWLYASGFPKSHDTERGLDKMIAGPWCDDDELERGTVSHVAAYWEGWGTALKPACEIIALARKPLSEGTVAANVLRWRTGAINIDGCRVEHASEVDRASATPQGRATAKPGALAGKVQHDGERIEFERPDTSSGRWPANIVHDGSDEVLAAFPETAGPRTGGVVAYSQPNIRGDNFNRANGRQVRQGMSYAGEGSAARYFYCAKATKAERAGSKHPTVKPIKLVRYLVRMITPQGGVVLDPFAGTGTTAEAAYLEGFSSALIEMHAEYQQDIRNRMDRFPRVDRAPAASEPVVVRTPRPRARERRLMRLAMRKAQQQQQTEVA